MSKTELIAEFRSVDIEYKMKNYSIRAVRDLNIQIRRGMITALVGESGSGKTTAATALLNCISEPGVVTAGEISFFQDNGPVKIICLSESEINNFRWDKVSMVFQGAQSSLNPIMTIYDQFLETMHVHRPDIKRDEAIRKSVELLEFVNLDPSRIMSSYPHELSGGMKQRVMIAFSLLLDPDMIILDEPTTALDVITQDFIFKLLKIINREKEISMLLLTHDISVVAKYADYMGVMYCGTLMEFGSVLDVFQKTLHPYSAGLIAATPSLYKAIEEMKPIDGTPPNLLAVPDGCPFHPRCSKCMDICRVSEPDAKSDDEGHMAKCHLFKNEGIINEQPY